MAKLTLEKIRSLVAENNRSAVLTSELLVCLIWKESEFDPAAKNRKSSATGLMQVTKGAVEDVNKNTPKGVHFTHSDMTDPAKNIQCGSYYLDLRIKWAGGKIKEGLEGFGTGPGYATSIQKCEACMQGAIAKFTEAATSAHQSCLFIIHK